MIEELQAAQNRLHRGARFHLRQRGVSDEALGRFGVGLATIEIHALDIFSFAEAGNSAFVIPVHASGLNSAIVDSVAWRPGDPTRIYSHHYLGSPLGGDQLDHAEFWSEPILLHPHPLAWLAADGVGAVILDWAMSAPQLRQIPHIVVDDPDFGREVKRQLTMPVQTCPEIRVRIGRVTEESERRSIPELAEALDDD